MLISRIARALLILFFVGGTPSCGDDDSGDGGSGSGSGSGGSTAQGAPPAPSMLMAEPLGAGAHLTWKDNSTNEAQFVIRRKEGSGSFADVGTVPFDTTVHHDEPLESGKTYTYVVSATNDQGMSDSAPVDFTMP